MIFEKKQAKHRKYENQEHGHECMTCKSLSQSDLQNLRIRNQLCELNDSIKPSSITTTPNSLPGQVLQPLDKSEALRPEIFQKLYVSPMKVHGCSSGSHSIYKLFPLRSFHPAEKQLEKRSRSMFRKIAKYRNRCFPVLGGCFTPIETVKATLCHPQAERHLDPIGSGFRDQRYLKTCWDDGFSLRWRLGQACFV